MHFQRTAFTRIINLAALTGALVLGGQSVAQASASPAAATPIEEAKFLYEKAKEKDPEAMYALAILVIAQAPKSQAEYESSNWPKYGGRYVFGRHALLQEAADLGSKKAAAYLCKAASDPGAPARYRSSKDKWCSAAEQ